MSEPREVRDPEVPEPADATIHVELVVAPVPGADPEELGALAQRFTADALPVLREATGLDWRSRSRPRQVRSLDSEDPRPPVDFLDIALLTMVRTPGDVVVVVTDAPLLSPQRTLVPGLAAPAANVVVVSTAKLVRTPFGHGVRDLGDPSVRWNAAALLVHLVGHLLELDHGRAGAMRPFAFEEDRRSVDRLGEEPGRFASAARTLLEDERETPTRWRRAIAQVTMAFQRPRTAFGPVIRSRAPLLPFRLGKLTAAAIAPAVVILFTDEYWWAAINLRPWQVWLGAGVAVLVGTAFLLLSQNLLFPHRDRDVLTRHVALTNAAITVNTLVLMAGLLATVALAVLATELLLFPPDYLQEWFDGRFAVGFADHIHLALVVGSAGAVSGALGGSFHGRTLLREYALFLREP